MDNSGDDVKVEVKEPERPTILVTVAGVISEIEDIRKELIDGTLSYHDMFE